MELLLNRPNDLKYLYLLLLEYVLYKVITIFL